MKAAAGTRAILDALSAQHPRATTELAFSSPFELLVATILSAQTTDQRVNQVTPALFLRFPDPAAMAVADPADVEGLVRPTGFFRQKARAIIGVARALVEQHGGRVPAEMSALVSLPGVGRKTANVVLGHALGVPGLAVDRHVLRVANRIGIARSPDPDTVEVQLTGAISAGDWTMASDTLILHGRRICRPKPLCDRCAVRRACEFARTGGALPRATRSAGARGPRRAPDAAAPRPPGRSRRRSR